MKLLEISVKNFRSINNDNITLDLTNSNIIFILGQNNAGKSALLSAYEYLVTPKQKVLLSDFLNFEENNQIEIRAVFEKEEEDDSFFLKKGFNKWVDSNNKIRFRKTWTKADQEGAKETWDPETEEYQINGFGGLETHFNHHAPTAIRIPAFPSVDELSKWVKDTLKKSVLKQIKDDEADAYEKVIKTIQELQDKIIGKDVFSQINLQANENFKEVFPDLSLSISQTEFDLSKHLESEFSVIINDTKSPDIKPNFNHHGHGVIRQAMFNLLGIVKNKLSTDGSAAKKFIILFEEPEAYLHPKAIKLLRGVLYKICEESPFQVICASHSPNLIDIARPHTSLVRLERKADGRTYIYQAGDNLFATDDAQKDKVQMINRFDPNVCESFFADEVLMVEGDTEAIVCREILASKCPSKDLFVLNTGSKNNIPFFQKIFTHFNIKHHIIHDSDTRYNYKTKVNEDGTLIYIPDFKKDGTQSKNSAWTLNRTIWKAIETANAKTEGLSQRLVSVYNFEVANKYKHDKEKGKPLSAFEFANKHTDISSTNICKFLMHITGEELDMEDYSQDNLEKIVTEPPFALNNIPVTVEELAKSALEETDTIEEKND